MDLIAVDVKRGAELTGLSQSALRKFIRTGALKASRVGRRLVIPVSELHKLIRTGTGDDVTVQQGSRS